MPSWINTRRKQYSYTLLGKTQWFLHRVIEYLAVVFQFIFFEILKRDVIGPVIYLFQTVRNSKLGKPFFDKLENSQIVRSTSNKLDEIASHPASGYYSAIAVLCASIYYYWQWNLHHYLVTAFIALYCSRLLIWCPPLFFIYCPFLILWYLMTVNFIWWIVAMIFGFVWSILILVYNVIYTIICLILFPFYVVAYILRTVRDFILAVRDLVLAIKDLYMNIYVLGKSYLNMILIF